MFGFCVALPSGVSPGVMLLSRPPPSHQNLTLLWPPGHLGVLGTKYHLVHLVQGTMLDLAMLLGNSEPHFVLSPPGQWSPD